MVNIYCDTITQEMKEVAREIADRQKDVVKIITPTETLEVSYEEVSEVQEQEDKGTQEAQEEQH